MAEKAPGNEIQEIYIAWRGYSGVEAPESGIVWTADGGIAFVPTGRPERPEYSFEEYQAKWREQQATAEFADIVATVATGGIGARIHERHEAMDFQGAVAPADLTHISQGAERDIIDAQLPDVSLVRV